MQSRDPYYAHIGSSLLSPNVQMIEVAWREYGSFHLPIPLKYRSGVCGRAIFVTGVSVPFLLALASGNRARGMERAGS
jgi:hypothetical protein